MSRVIKIAHWEFSDNTELAHRSHIFSFISPEIINRFMVSDITMARRAEVLFEKIELPTGFKDKLAFVLYNVLTPEECQSYINTTEKKGYEMALVNVGGGRQRKIEDVRNSSRHIWDSQTEADKIWERIKEYVPKVFKNRKVLGLNERLRFLRYDKGEYFKPHMDGIYTRENGERSYVTVQLYLNEGFEGGATTFFSYNMEETVPVVPKTGSALIFQHDILHEGSELKKGRKYAVRTDVMYAAEKEVD